MPRVHRFDDDITSSGTDADTDSGSTGDGSDSDPTTPTTDPTTPTSATATTGDTDPVSTDTDTVSGGTDTTADTDTDSTAGTDTAGDSGSDSSGGGVVCGDDALEGKEVCDGAELADETCESQGFVGGGELACADDCTEYDTTGCVAQLCPNDIVEGDEVCDGADLADMTCADLGFVDGTLGCAKDCSGFDTSLCTTALSMCSTPAAPIGFDGTVLTTDTITLPAGVFVADVNISVDAAHAAVGELDLTITHNDTTTTARLQSGICGADMDIDGEYDAGAAATPACGGPPAVDGAVLPEGSLDAFTGIPDPAGVWQLDITDNDTDINSGTLNEWCVNYLVTEGNPEACGNDVVTYTETCDGTNVPGTCSGAIDDLAGYGVLGCAADCSDVDAADCCTADVGDGGAYVANLSDGAGAAACADTGIIDISATGTATAAAGNCNFDSTPITLPTAFDLHGEPQTDWFVNVCGYISAENTGDGDYTNDCPMDDDRPGTIAVFHDDLDTAEGGIVYYEHFDAGMCPRDSDLEGAVECDVFFWNGINPWNTTTVIDLNLVLYPTTGEAVSVYGPNTPVGTPTIGISSVSGETSFTASCNDDTFTTPNDGTVCMLPSTSACPA
ncbi:MAG: hypothetical protein KUG77_16910 [Nannocystaceae bacterium]|nr:hypothetical protein [Nannocystaceae bacterium]